MNASTITVEENGQGRYQQTIRVGAHELLADEPADMGGGDAGPAPYDFLLAALGACTSITLRMYAERKALPLTKISVALRHEKIETDGQPVDRIEREITLEGELSNELRTRMLEIAEKCPVYRTLSGQMQIDSVVR
ncbi:MAG: OsmC family protein [Betaproteobacteria bacterium]|nr:OsmC family protein [Betaproteobacteria bacterium]